MAGGEEQRAANSPFEAYKRKLYFVMMLSGTLSTGFAWATNEWAQTVSPFTRAVFALVLFATAGISALLYSGRVSNRFVQEAVYFTIGSVLLAVGAYALYADIEGSLRDISLFSACLFYPFLYIFVFLAYEERGALVRSLCVYALSVGITLPAVFSPAYQAGIVMPTTIGLSYLASALIILQLFLLSRLKESLRTSELAAEKMERLAKVDPLTSVLNRRGFREITAHRIREALERNEPLSMVVFDLDDFKALNDQLGHDAGDEALVRVARGAAAELRDGDALARWGGEEFAVLLPRASGDEAYLLAERLRRAVRELKLSAEDWSLSASFGVASLSLGGSEGDLVKQADIALYAAKRSGKDRTVLYGAEPPDERSAAPHPG